MKYRGELLIFSAALIFGTTLVFQRVEGLKGDGEGIPPISFSALRQTVSLITMLLLNPFLRKIQLKVETSEAKRLDCSETRMSRVTSLCYFASIVAIGSTGGNICQQLGLTSVGAGKTAFLIACSVILTPLVDCIMYRDPRQASATDWLAALTAIFGVFLLTDCSLYSLGINRAEFILLLGALFGSVNICFADFAAKILNTIDLTIADFLFSSLFSILVALLFFESEREALFDWVLLRSNMSLVILTGMAQALGVLLCKVGFMSVSSSRACLLMSLESVVAAIMANILLGEDMTPSEIAGAVVLMGSILISVAGKGEDHGEQERRAALAYANAKGEGQQGYGAIPLTVSVSELG